MNESELLKLLPTLREAAKKKGYAIGLHGSLTRDFDIIAIPWVNGAFSADDLALAIYKAAGGKRWRVWWDVGSPKPHGRKCYAFDWKKTNENKGYVDLSVMPRGEETK